MKVHLMSPKEDFDPELTEQEFSEDLAQDLQLDYLWDAMADGDKFLRTVARAALLRPVHDPEAIQYRQRAFNDCIQQRDTVEEIYKIAVDALDMRHGFLTAWPNHPEQELAHAVQMLTGLTDQLDRLRKLCPVIENGFASPAFRNLAKTIAEELNEEYMQSLRAILRELKFPGGLLMSAGIGPGGVVTNQILRRGKESNRRFFNRTPLKRPMFFFALPERDEAGFHALSELRERSLNEVANAASQALEHVRAFFSALRIELGFYLACGNLREVLQKIGSPLCVADPFTRHSISTRGLYDPCLALRTSAASVGNDIDLESSRLLVITGANRGGKSTLLRAIGTAQLMMQAGMPTPAEHFEARPVGRVFPHWAREEDSGLVHGKLDEELDRMARITSAIKPGDLLLCNESFASTNEAEGSQILFEVTSALVHSKVQVRSVTHLYDFAHATASDESLHTVGLRAPRADTGERSYRLEPGPPLPTSFGLDLYDHTFGTTYANVE